MDADITVFDPKTVKANATWDDVAALNDGFHYTLVNGVFILKDGKIVTDVLPPGSRSGERQRGTRNRTQMPDIVGLKNGWQIAGTPTFAYNHKAEKGSRFTLPLGTGVVKVTSIGKLPIKLALQYWYYVAAPDNFGPKHQIRLQIAPVVPLPW
jgi:hypothetical protein